MLPGTDIGTFDRRSLGTPVVRDDTDAGDFAQAQVAEVERQADFTETNSLCDTRIRTLLREMARPSRSRCWTASRRSTSRVGWSSPRPSRLWCLPTTSR